MIDTFNPDALPIGCEVVIRAPHDVSVVGVVKNVDVETQTVEFTNGMAYKFGPPEEPEPEVTP